MESLFKSVANLPNVPRNIIFDFTPLLHLLLFISLENDLSGMASTVMMYLKTKATRKRILKCDSEENIRYLISKEDKRQDKVLPLIKQFDFGCSDISDKTLAVLSKILAVEAVNFEFCSNISRGALADFFHRQNDLKYISLKGLQSVDLNVSKIEH